MLRIGIEASIVNCYGKLEREDTESNISGSDESDDAILSHLPSEFETHLLAIRAKREKRRLRTSI